MKRTVRYLKFICVGLVGTLIVIFLVNQIPTERDAAVSEVIQNYQPDLTSNELTENPLFVFLQQNQHAPELMAVYAHLLSTTELPKIPPRMSLHKPIISMIRWNKELLKHAETHTEKEKLKDITGIIDQSSKLLNNNITILEFKIFITSIRLTLDWAATQKWSAKSTPDLKELLQKTTLLLEKREDLVKNALNGERELSFQIVLDTDFTNLDLANLDSKPSVPAPKPNLRTQVLLQIGPWFFDRNETLNTLNTRFNELGATTVCLQDYSCDKLKVELLDVSMFSMVKNPVGKGILKLIAIREHDMIRNQEAFLKLEESNKAFAAGL
jgi:hypothetical protein